MNFPTTAGAAACFTLACATPLSAQSWEGFYLGGFIGAGSGEYTLGVSEIDEQGPVVTAEDVMIGVRASRRKQSGSNVFGFDVDASQGVAGTIAQGSADESLDWVCQSGDCNITIETLLAARVSYGVLLTQQTLGYVAAGLAAAQVDGGIANSEQQGSSTAVGFTAAIGVEQRLSNGLNVFGEYGYYDLGDLEFGRGSDVGTTFDGIGDFETFKIGVTIRF